MKFDDMGKEERIILLTQILDEKHGIDIGECAYCPKRDANICGGTLKERFERGCDLNG